MDTSQKPLIIAIDDQPPILHRIVYALKDHCHIKPFTSGRTALEHLNRQIPDLILLDYQMPEISGMEILEQLKADAATQGIPVIFLTGSGQGNTEVEALEKGAADYIFKPIKEQVLLARVRLQLELARYRTHMETVVEEKTQKIKKREAIALDLLARATDMRDHETGGHIRRTTEMVRIIVNHLMKNPTAGYSLTSEKAYDIIESAKLHDLGKIAVPDMILLKPGKLTEEEFKIIKRHTLNGAEMLDEHIAKMGDDSFLNTARDIALYHHEKWDGSGYPYGLRGDATPLSARITAVADVYDALTSTRPYKEPFSHSKAVEIIKSNSGSHFDPKLADVFMEHEKEFENIVLTTE